MSSNEGSIKKRLDELEEEVRRLKEPLETTLMDVRELISNLENPFNYVANILELDKLRRRNEGDIKERVVREVEKAEEEIPLSKISDKQVPSKQKISPAPSGMSNLLASLACACILLRLLGSENTMRFLRSRIVKQLAPPEILEGLNDAIDFLLRNHEEFQGIYLPEVRHLNYESLLAAAYVISILGSINDDKFFTALLLGLIQPDLKVKKER
ncbi:MAG: hypothetical protein DRN49_00710 [Thaumarchaeota archaeon]|nr:MAG: hypothetical protein DRN49_00710 [Nitrososphaerota archaeon]